MGNLLTKLKIRWNFDHFRRSLQSYLSYDYNRCLQLILFLGGGVRPANGAEPWWKRSCSTLYRLLGFYQFAMSLASVGFSIQNQDDLVGLFASIVLAMGLTEAFVNICILDHYGEVIGQTKTFLRSNTANSSDPEYDESVRRYATRTAGKMTLGIICMLCCDQVVLWVPNSARDRILSIPRQFQVFGSVTTRLLLEAYVSTLVIFWGSRYFCTTLTIIPMLMGLRSELTIVARGYETIEDRVQARVLADQKTSAGTSRKLTSNEELRWLHLKRILETSVEHHVEVFRNIQLVQPVVSQLYATLYYSTMIAVSMFVLLVIRSEPSLVSVVLFLSGCIFLLECYLWCKLTDSFKEIMEKIADAAAQLGFQLERSVDNRSEYIQMRTSAMIVQLNASQSVWFSCGGFFPISVDAFGNLCMIIYRFATFLMDLD